MNIAGAEILHVCLKIAKTSQLTPATFFFLFAELILVFSSIFGSSNKVSDMESKGKTDFRNNGLLELFKEIHQS